MWINETRDGVIVPFDKAVQCDPLNNNLPEDGDFRFEIEMIVGGNHSEFAHCGSQLFPMDWQRMGVSLEEQQAKAIKWTADFILESNKQ